MLVFEEDYEESSVNVFPFPNQKESLVFIDMETTGLFPESSSVYLIGVLYFSEGAFRCRQWFADGLGEEETVLSAFLSFLSERGFQAAVTFFGERFSFPYLQKKCACFELEGFPGKLANIDLYPLLLPCRSLLKLNNLKFKTLEGLLSLKRSDRLSGKETAALYSACMQSKIRKLEDAEEKQECLLLHNREDVLHLAELTGLLHCRSLLLDRHPTARLCRSGKSLHISFDLDFSLPVPVTAEKNRMELSASGCFANLTVPLFHGEMKHFFPDYKNYYYLPAEDHAVHKSVAAYVDRKFREKANAHNCYTRKAGYFAPCLPDFDAPIFKDNAGSTQTYLEVTDKFLNDREAAAAYLSHLLKQFAA